jgi:hypothetical protein
MPLLAAAAAGLGTSGALMVGAAGYGIAAWVGRLLLSETERTVGKEKEAPLVQETPP